MLSQLRDLGVIASPRIYAPSESATNISAGRGSAKSGTAKAKEDGTDQGTEGEDETEGDGKSDTSEPAPPTTEGENDTSDADTVDTEE